MLTRFWNIRTTKRDTTKLQPRRLALEQAAPKAVPMYASQTEASWARSAKLTEFQRVKEAVQRLEHTSREQLVRAPRDACTPSG